MGKDEDTCVNKQVSGSLKEAIGKITGDAETQAEGAAEKKSGETHRNKSAKTAETELRKS